MNQYLPNWIQQKHIEWLVSRRQPPCGVFEFKYYTWWLPTWKQPFYVKSIEFKPGQLAAYPRMHQEWICIKFIFRSLSVFLAKPLKSNFPSVFESQYIFRYSNLSKYLERYTHLYSLWNTYLNSYTPYSFRYTPVFEIEYVYRFIRLSRTWFWGGRLGKRH